MTATRVLVLGGSGAVGRAAIGALAALGVSPTSASRTGAGGIALDMRDAEAVAGAARGYDAALLITPVAEDEAVFGVRAVKALRRAGVYRIVSIGIHNCEAMQSIPHFANKVPIKHAVLEDGRSTVLEANFFFQNDLLFADAIRFAGVYPLPIGQKGVFSIDVADLGAAAAQALTRDDWAGAAVAVCGPQRLTGLELAQNWQAALARDVRYGGDAIGPFIGGLRAALPQMSDWLVRDFETMMEVTQAMGCPATDAEIARATALVGRPLNTHRSFAARIAHEQQASARA